MALVNGKTLIVTLKADTDLHSNPQLAALLSGGWQISGFERVQGTEDRLIRLIRPLSLQIPDAEDEIVWQGRPPFPGIPKQMRNNPGETSSNPGAINL